MAILSSTFNLSNNVKYINAKIDTTPSGGGALSGSASLSDKKTLMHTILRAISTNIDDTAANPINKTLGWQRLGSEDSAGDVAEGSGYDAGTVYGFLRSRCYDYGATGRDGLATNDHYKYLRLKLFERDDKILPANEFDSSDRSTARYATSDNVLVLRWDMYSDWNPTVLANMLDSADAYVDSDAIHGGIGLADADGFGKSSGDLAYEAQSDAWNYTRFGGNSKFNKFVNTANNTTRADGNNPIIASRDTTNGELPRGNSILYDMYYDRYGQTGFGHSDLSYKVQHQELTFNIDGNFTMWLFGDQDRVGSNLDSLPANRIAEDASLLQVDSIGADARYLCMFATQMQDQDPELNGPYNTVLMATEYRKEFGEAAPTNDFIHNGTMFTANSLLMNNGMATPNSFNAYEGYSMGVGATNNGGNLNTFTPGGGSNTFHRTAGGIQHGTKYRNTDGGMTNNNIIVNTRLLAEHSAFYSNTNLVANTQEPNAHQARDFVSEYGQQGDNVNSLASIFSNNATNNARVERGGNILMGLSTSHHSEDVNNTNQGDRNASYGVASNSSQSNVRDRNLGNYVVKDANDAYIQNTKNTTHGGLTWADWDNDTNGARGIRRANNSSSVAYDGTGVAASKELHWYGADGAQFMLTEYPAREAGASTLRGDTNSDNQALQTAESINTFNAYGTPQSGREYLSATRLHMGWLGYIGHQNSQTCYSLNEAWFGSRHGLFGDNKGLQPIGALSEHIPGKSDLGRPISFGPGIPMVSNMLDSYENDVIALGDSGREMFQEFHPTPDQQVNYSVYEPILSVGTSKMTAGGMYSFLMDGNVDKTEANDNVTFFANSNSNFAATAVANGEVDAIAEMGNPGGENKKLSAFAMLGRCYGMKIFGPYRHHKYNYLDAVSIQVDDDGFYAVNPTNSVDHWVVPMNHTQCALLLKK